MDPNKPFCQLLFALQYYEGDKSAAEELMLLLADLEPVPRPEIPFLVVYRFDATPPRKGVLDYFEAKFPDTRVLKGKKWGRGHPQGCNALWCDTMKYAKVLSEEGYTGVFTFEADTFPLVPGWIDCVRVEWDLTQKEGKDITGFWAPKSGGLPEHINGNAIFPADLLKRFPHIYDMPCTIAWDLGYAPLFRPTWRPSTFIYNAYRQNSWTDEQFEEQLSLGRCLLHGIRDSSAHQWVRKKYLQPAAPGDTLLSRDSK